MSSNDIRRLSTVLRIQSLRRSAHDAYRNYRREEAADLFLQALRLAEDINSPDDMVYLRLWHGVSLAGAQQYMEALAAVTPTLRQMDKAGRPQDVFNTVTLYIGVALEIPLDFKTILEPLEYCKTYLESTGSRHWRHKLLYLEARLLEERGFFEQALAVAEESWSTWRYQYPYYTADTHLERLVSLSLRTHQPELARRYLDIWEQDSHNEMPLYRAYTLSGWQANYYRYRDELDRALTLGVRCLHNSAQIDKEDKARGLLVRLYLARGEIDKARQTLKHVPLKTLRDEQLRMADYHLGAARAAAGLPPADDGYDIAFPTQVATAVQDVDRLRFEAGRARMMYRLRMVEAKKWDTAFDCTWRQDEVNERLARLAAIERRVEGQ